MRTSETMYQRVGYGQIAYLCPACLRPSLSGPKVPDEENRECNCGEQLDAFVRIEWPHPQEQGALDRPEPGWLNRSLERARKNIEARPEHLKPKRYRNLHGKD